MVISQGVNRFRPPRWVATSRRVCVTSWTARPGLCLTFDPQSDRKGRAMPYAYVVEDHQDTANCLSQWLRLFNYEVRIALGPLAAIEALAGRVPDVIIIDIHMHGMDGIE